MANLVKQSPIINWYDLVGMGNYYGLTENFDAGINLATDTYLMIMCGYKRSGKTMLATYMALKAAYMYGYEIYSNYYIKAMVVTKDKKFITIESKKLDMQALYRLERSVDGAIVIIDELPLYADAATSGALANRLLGYTINMAGKRHINYIFTSQNFDWCYNRVRWSIDIRFDCQDFSKKYPASKKYQRGELVLVDAYDLSGQWTGDPYGSNKKGDEWGTHVSCGLYAKPIWGSYDTEEAFDVIETQTNRVTREDLEKEERAEDRQYTGEAIYEQLVFLKERHGDRIDATQLWNTLNDAGINGSATELGKYLRTFKVAKGGQKSNGERWYDLSKLDTSKSLVRA